MDWRLRIRGPGFVETLSVSSASTLGELMEDIKEKIKINSFQGNCYLFLIFLCPTMK